MKTRRTFLGGRRTQVAVAAALLVTGASACSSASSSSGSAGSGGSTQAAAATIKLGLIADLTGPYSSAFLTAEKGVKAYVQMINDEGGVNGHQLSYVVADSTSTACRGPRPPRRSWCRRTAFSAVVSDLAVFFGAEPYLLRQGVRQSALVLTVRSGTTSRTRTCSTRSAPSTSTR